MHVHICAQHAATLEDVDMSALYLFLGGETCPSCFEIDANGPQMPPKQNIFVLLKQYFSLIGCTVGFTEVGALFY